jgi:hypothetical protein
MGSARNFFIKIDQFIFAKLDQLKNESSFQKINDLMLNLNDEQQKILTQIIVFSIIIIPYLFISVFWWSNHKIKQTIENKNQIIEQIAYLNGNKDALNNVSVKYLAGNAINSQDEIRSKLVNIASRYQINSGKVTVESYNILSSTSTITKIESSISFHDFGTQDFSNFMREIVEVEKFKITNIDIHRNNETNLLQGKIDIRHVGRNNSFN